MVTEMPTHEGRWIWRVICDGFVGMRDDRTNRGGGGVAPEFCFEQREVRSWRVRVCNFPAMTAFVSDEWCLLLSLWCFYEFKCCSMFNESWMIVAYKLRSENQFPFFSHYICKKKWNKEKFTLHFLLFLLHFSLHVFV